MSLACRMYEKQWPSPGELVVVQVKSVAEHGAYCSLLEYNLMEGLILMSELSRRRIRSYANVIRVGKQEVVRVMAVDREKGYIDLSKKRVAEPELVRSAELRWNKSKAVHSILRHAARVVTPHSRPHSVESLYRQFVWPLAADDEYRLPGDDGPHPYDVLKSVVRDPATWRRFCVRYRLSGELSAVIARELVKRMRPQIVRISAHIDVTCFSRDGIVAIKRALGRALEVHNTSDEMVARITLVCTPLFKISLTTSKGDEGVDKIRAMIDTIREDTAGVRW